MSAIPWVPGSCGTAAAPFSGGGVGASGQDESTDSSSTHGESSAGGPSASGSSSSHGESGSRSSGATSSSFPGCTLLYLPSQRSVSEHFEGAAPVRIKGSLQLSHSAIVHRGAL